MPAPRTKKDSANASDPFRKRGQRGITKRGIERSAVKVKIARELMRHGSLTARELARLADGFNVPALIVDHLVFGARMRRGRGGGIELVDREKLQGYLDSVEPMIATLRVVGETRPLIERHLPEASAPTAPSPSIEGDGQATPGPSHTGDGWAALSADFLASRYSAAELTGYLPPRFAEAWCVSKGLARNDVPGTAAEVAEALVRLHDTDLLANAVRLRHRIAADCKLEPLARFHPGSAAVCWFLRQVGLPIELAGEPEPERPPAIVPVFSFRRLPELVDYQITGKNQMVVVLSEAGSAIYSVPTGGGKTRTAWEAVFEYVASLRSNTSGNRRNVILWLAHRNELLDQACACMQDVWRSREGDADAMLLRLWGRNTRDALERLDDVDVLPHDCVVIVSTPATMAAMLDETLNHRAPILRQSILDRTGVIVVDEAHRAAAPSYVDIIHALKVSAGGDEPVAVPPPIALLGLTATPFRSKSRSATAKEETQKLVDIFGELLVPRQLGANPQHVLVKRKILARPVFEDLYTGAVLDIEAQLKKLRRKNPNGPLSAGQEELIDRWLAIQASDSPERHAFVLQAVLARAQSPDVHMMYFGPTVANAQLMAVALTRSGIPAAVVSGATRGWTRKRLIDGFRKGDIRVLCNCEVLTAGFDAPLVTHVVVARPTTSLVLYQQIIGRGLRGPKFGGTASCAIVNCIDNVKMGNIALAHATYRKMWEEGVTDDD